MTTEVLDLNKDGGKAEGAFIDLGKQTGSNIKRIEVSLTWTQNTTAGEPYDPDVVAFLLDENDKVFGGSLKSFIRAFGRDEAAKNLVSTDGSVTHGGDDTTGAGGGEKLIIDASRFSPGVAKVRIAVTIFQAKARQHNFGLIKRCKLTVKNADTGETIVTGDLQYGDTSVFTAINAMDVFLHEGSLSVQYLGEGYTGGSLGALCQDHGITIGENKYDN